MCLFYLFPIYLSNCPGAAPRALYSKIKKICQILPPPPSLKKTKKKRLLKPNTLHGRPSLRFTKTAHARATLRSVYNNNVYVNIFVTYRYPAVTKKSWIRPCVRQDRLVSKPVGL